MKMMAVGASKNIGIISILITFLLISIPVQAKYSGGMGEPNDPYQIAEPNDWVELMNTSSDWDKNFIMTADIDVNGIPLTPVGMSSYSQSFRGFLDGNGHIIYNADVNMPHSDYVGLFGYVRGNGKINNLGLENIQITGEYTVGGLVGYNEGNITSCYSTGTVSKVEGYYNVGGLVGFNDEGTISNCYSTGNVKGSSNAGGLVGENYEGTISNCYSSGLATAADVTGGLVGYNRDNITNCYSTSRVASGYTGSVDYTGGLVGFNDEGTISNCYSTGIVSGNNNAGGLAGFNRGNITYCYSTGAVIGNNYVGGLVGENSGSALYSIWDIETSGLSESKLGIGLTTEQMMDPNMLGLNGFANNPNWVLDAGNDYPRLAWEGTPGEIIGEPVIYEGSGIAEDPYKIDSAELLILIDKASILWDKDFILETDIDLDPNLYGGQIFGQAVIPSFSGIFDGNDHTISNMVLEGGSYLGLFGKLESGAEVRNLGIMDANITGNSKIGGLVGENDGTVTNCSSSGTVSGNSSVGGLVGFNFEVGNVSNCYSIGMVSGDDDNVGGLVGSNRGNITNCYSTGTVNGKDYWTGGLVGFNWGTITNCYRSGSVSGDEYVGGLVGSSQVGSYSGTITNCYSTGTVIGNNYVGGLVGYSRDNNITNCYSTSTVSGDEDVGGLVGDNFGGTVSNCYSSSTVSGGWYVGGLVGSNFGTLSKCYSIITISGEECVGGFVGYNSKSMGYMNNCFWDIEDSNILDGVGNMNPDPNGIVGKTTLEMYDPNTFLDVGWDFIGETINGPNDVWKMWDGYDYPHLTCEPGPNTPLVFVDINDPNFYGQMSKYEVTNDQYCDFLNAALASGDITINEFKVEGANGLNVGEDYVGESYYQLNGLGWTGAGATSGSAARIHYNEGEFSVDSDFGNHPVTYVSWYGAMAFANYYGYYLPTEDQWQAVADYDGTYIYGCGETINSGIANYRDSENPDGTTSVGIYGLYGYDMSDMAGNVWEWTSSGLDSSRIFRGGSWSSYDSDCDVSIRGDGIPYANYYDIGFRVCR